MIITLSTPEGKPLVQIRSMSDGLNYQIYLRSKGTEKKGKLYNKKGAEIKREWQDQNCYAQSIEHAIRLGVQQYLLLLDENADISVSDKVFKEAAKAVEKMIKAIKIEVEK